MFRNAISSTPYTTADANDLFNNKIYGDGFNGDYTFLSTLRALVYSRMQEDDTLRLRFKASSYTQSDVRTYAADRMFSAMIGSTDSFDNSLIVHNLKGSADDNEACMNLFDQKFCETFSGFIPVDKVAAFYQKSFDVRCFVDPERKASIIVVKNLDLRRMHYLQCSILAVLPWYLDPSKGVTELEMELIRSMRENTSDPYMECLRKMIKEYDFRTARIKNLLRGFETRADRDRMQALEAEMSSLREQIRDYNRYIGDFYNQITEKSVIYNGLAQKIESGEVGDSEIMDYFMCNSRLDLRAVDNHTMVFVVKDFLEFFDEDAAERYIANQNSFVYSNRRRISKDDMKKFMTAVFLDRTLKIRMCAAYQFDLGGNVRAKSYYDFGGDYADSMPNPHINRYGCLGNYERAINEILSRQDYVGAIEQCVASCRSLNWHDSTVMNEFMRIINGTSDNGFNNICVELPDGRIVDPEVAIAWLSTESA